MIPFKIDSGHINDFQENGFLLVKSLVTKKEVDLILETAQEDQVIQQDSISRFDAEGNKAKLTLWFTPGEDIYSMLSRSENMVNIVEALLGGEVAHFHSKLMQKEPRVGGAWEWHQDYGYWYNEGFLFPDMLSAYVAITQATKENGCLQVIKGSHKMGRVSHGLTGDQAGADTERVKQCLEIRDKIYCEMEPGDVLFFHSNLLHRSSANRSDKPRWSIITAYNKTTNIPFIEHRSSCTAPIKTVNNDMILEVGKTGLNAEINDMLSQKDAVAKENK